MSKTKKMVESAAYTTMEKDRSPNAAEVVSMSGSMNSGG